MGPNLNGIVPLVGAGRQLYGAAIRCGPVEQNISGDNIILKIAAIDVRRGSTLRRSISKKDTGAFSCYRPIAFEAA